MGADQAAVFGESVAYITDVPVSSQEVANKIAKAEMERLARQYANGKCVVRGENTIRAGSVVNFKGFVKGLNGKFYVVSSRHLINPSSGYQTEFKFDAQIDRKTCAYWHHEEQDGRRHNRRGKRYIYP